jgi:heptaprenyl diphosphate synthase
VPTLPTLYLARLAQTDAAAAGLQERIQLAVDADEDARLEELARELYEHPVTQATRDEARAYAQRALDALSVIPDGAVKQALVGFADHVVSRTS